MRVLIAGAGITYASWNKRQPCGPVVQPSRSSAMERLPWRTQAQGANQALEDAWLLSRALRADPADLPGALRRYEAMRARRVRKVARRAATERTNKPVPSLVRGLTSIIPSSLIGKAYLAQLRGVSTILNNEAS